MNNKKYINSRCICKITLNWVNTELIMLDPCEHILHYKCYKENKNKSKCDLCETKIDKIYTEKQLIIKKNNPKYYQKYVDMLSVKNLNNMSEVNNFNLITNIPKIIGTFLTLPYCRGINDGKSLIHEIMNIGNVKLQVEGLNNIPKGPKVIIANHTSDFDFIPLFYIFQSGFLSSSILYDSMIGKMISKIVTNVIVTRGDKNGNTVNKMKQHVKKYGSICLFPEGLITHPDTIIRFRTGAFNIGYQVCPVVITYDPVIYDSNIGNYIKKILSQDEFNIKINILPTEQPPFTENKIEEIRLKMAKTGNFALSRVINRDIKDNNKI